MNSVKARVLRKNLTDAERKLWQVLRLKQTGYKFRRQHPIGQFIVDFVCLEKKLIIEVDGGQHSKHADAGRSRWLQKEGYRIIRFWNNQVLQQEEPVAEVIWAVLNKPDNHPRPGPPPSRGREREKRT